MSYWKSEMDQLSYIHRWMYDNAAQCVTMCTHWMSTFNKIVAQSTTKFLSNYTIVAQPTTKFLSTYTIVAQSTTKFLSNYTIVAQSTTQSLVVQSTTNHVNLYDCRIINIKHHVEWLNNKM